MQLTQLKEECFRHLQSDSNLLELLQTQSVDGIWYWRSSKEIWASDSFWKCLGYRDVKPAATLHSCLDQASAESLPALLETLKASAELHITREHNACFRHRSGRSIWMQFRNHPIGTEGSGNLTLIRQLPETEVPHGTKSAELANALLNSNYLYFLKTDLEGNFTFLNDFFCQRYGLPREETLGQPSLETILEKDHAKCQQTVQNCLEQPNLPFPVRLRKITPSGLKVTGQWEFMALSRADGQPREILCLGYDITPQRQLQQHSRALINTLSDTVLSLDTAGVIAYASSIWGEQFGFPTASTPGMAFPEACALKDRNRTEQWLAQLQRQPTRALSLEHRLRRPGGEEIWVESRGIFEPKLKQTILVVRDISDRKNQVQELQKLTENVPGAIYQYELDKHGNTHIPFISQGIAKLHPSLSPAAIKQNPHLGFAIIVEEDRERMLQNIQRSARHLMPFEEEYRVEMPDGSLRWFSANAKPERRPDGSTVWYGIFQDINRQKELESIKAEAARLEAQNEEMEQFAYVASHDLQEPLRTVISFANLLQKRYADHLGKDGREYLEFITSASKRMSQLIQGLLEYSQLGKSRELQSVDTEQLIQEVLKDLSSTIAEHRALIHIEAPMPVVQGYPLELRQLFQNLISNAIKFSKPNEQPIVIIRGRLKTGKWLFEVSDSGIGIPQRFQEKIFGIFHRLHSSSNFEGSGIGLANCKKIVDLHQGEIWVESEEGKGSTFYFTLRKTSLPAQ
jgi:PAS domain S-box-containing protein